MNEPTLCQKFTAIAQIIDNTAYEIAPNIYRRHVDFKPSKSIPIHPLIPLRSFIKDTQHWGVSFPLWTLRG